MERILPQMGLQARAPHWAAQLLLSVRLARPKLVRETVAVMPEVRKLGWKEVKVLTTLPGRSGIVAARGQDAVKGLYGVGGWKLHEPDKCGRWVQQVAPKTGLVK